MTIKTLVVDDHRLFRAGIIELLHTIDGVEVVGEGGSADDALRLATSLEPHVIILDVEMPGPDVSVTIDNLAEVAPHSRIVVLTMHDDAMLLGQLVAAGVSGYLLKSADRSELAAAISAAHRSVDVVLVSVSRTTLLRLGRRPTPRADLLSPREVEVLQLVALGHSNHEISDVLMISEGTVKRHLTNVYAKLGANSRVSALRSAEAAGISLRSHRPGAPGLP